MENNGVVLEAVELHPWRNFCPLFNFDATKFLNENLFWGISLNIFLFVPKFPFLTVQRLHLHITWGVFEP